MEDVCVSGIHVKDGILMENHRFLLVIASLHVALSSRHLYPSPANIPLLSANGIVP